MRIHARRLALPATALAAALALTACQSDDSKASAAPAPAKPASTSASASSTPTTSPTPKPTQTGSTEQPTPKPTASKKSSPKPTTAPPAAPRTCTAANTKIVASKVTRPINHLVLTVTNVGSRACNALGAPSVGFDDAQAAIGVVEDSKPQAVVTLAPGESGYASVILTGEPGGDTHGRTVRTIKVYLTSDSGTTVTAPSGTFADDGAAVSYWQRTLGEALTY
ncbi:DUF4232 domain-containing protein [Streptomyces sp. NPDC094032]|uniref:DUF4232 domain-containing protein n=1 Tax=Streptomyces sp. NPDC094032 TaxID=3155308 RepID=UPI0033242016